MGASGGNHRCVRAEGPVNALDKASWKALERFYPEIRNIKLTDYKVRVLDSNSATASKVRVLIEHVGRSRHLDHHRRFHRYYRSQLDCSGGFIEHKLLSN